MIVSVTSSRSAAGTSGRGAGAPGRPKQWLEPHRDCHVLAADLDAARLEVARLVERDGLRVRSLSMGVDGAFRCVAVPRG